MPKFKLQQALVAPTLTAAVLLSAGGADWRQFRGTDGTAVVAEANLPTTWTETENVAWKADLPGKGVSSPIVVGDRVIVTASSGYREQRLHVLCFAADSGKPLWDRQFWATGRTLCHTSSAVAAPTPASDGKRIFAFYSSNDLICLDLEGNLLWLRGLTYDYPTAANDVGMASSPVVVGDTVVVQVECTGESFAAGIDAATGENRWRVERLKSACWTSPVAATLAGRPTVLLQSTDRLTAHDPQDGRQLWSYQAALGGIASPTVVGELIYAPGGGLSALKPDDATPAVLWQENRLDTSSASPVIHQGRSYTINRAGVLNAAAADSGAMLWQLRLKGPFWATPIASGDYLYVVNQDGLAQVIRLKADAGEIEFQHEFGEEILASPAAADGALYFRSNAHLWKIARP